MAGAWPAVKPAPFAKALAGHLSPTYAKAPAASWPATSVGPDKTVEAWRNLWLHTGDAGRFDDLGRLHYVDRIKDCVRRRGENISIFEVEQVLKAYVVPAAGLSVDPVALLDWCTPRMPYFAVPRFVEVVAGELANAHPSVAESAVVGIKVAGAGGEDEVKTPTGKLQKTALREAGITAATWDRESVGYVVRR